MDDETNARIDKYLEVYDRVNPVVKNAEVVSAIIEQIGKDTRCAWLMNDRSNGNGHSSDGYEAPATEKQMSFMRDLGIDMPKSCSKRQASQLIDEAQANAA